MRAIDGVLGRFRFWRELRGGVWERWSMLGAWPPRTRWFGPLPVPFDERVDGLALLDADAAGAALISSVRLSLWDSDSDVPPPTIEHLAAPALNCAPGCIAEAEDHR